MPDADGFPLPSEIANGYGKEKVDPTTLPGSVPIDQRQKAMQLISSGLPFLMIAIKPTFAPDDSINATGADFFTAIDGDKETIRDAKDHLSGIIERLMRKHGII